MEKEDVLQKMHLEEFHVFCTNQFSFFTSACSCTVPMHVTFEVQPKPCDRSQSPNPDHKSLERYIL